MFRLIKLALYVGIGYVLYEFLHDVTLPQQAQPRQGPSGGRGRGRGNQRQSHPQNMTGPAKGRRVQVGTNEDSGGHSELVGRGVVGH